MMTTATTDIQSLNFEQAMQELEGIVRRLEAGGGDLESSIVDFQRGTALQKHCQQKLAEAKLKVDAIMGDANGGAPELQPFDVKN